MSQATTIPAASSAAAGGLGRRTARGFAWMVSQTVLTKVAGTIGTIVLGKLLLDDHFAIAVVAYVFSVVPGLIVQGGLREILVQRHRHFRRWANAAFWMSAAQGLAAGIATVAMIPLAQGMYGWPELPGLLLLVAIAYPLDALSIVPQADLQNHMRFRFLAGLELGRALGQTGLSILFARMGFGAYSLILPRPIVSAAAAICCWSAVSLPIRRKWRLRRWRFLFSDSGIVFVSNACVFVMLNADYFILSRFQDKDTVGQYFFAFNLSLQTLATLTQNLGGVLFPALAKLATDPKRQVDGFLRATHLMAYLTLPACLGQAAIAEPLLRAIYGHKWDPAIVPLQILSVGMAMRTIGWPAVSLLNAQGRFVARMNLSIASFIAFVAMVCLGAWKSGIIGVATAVTFHTAIFELLHLLIALRPAGTGPGRAASLVIGPALVAAASIGPPWLLGELLPDWPQRDWCRVLVVFCGSALIYFPAMRLLAPGAWMEARARVTEVLGRRAAPAPGGDPTAPR